jgi:NTP pyrophosphatase (non-canonical NTP hydrolase)|tara:strand:+ start:1761 stop:2105 length:345 start_codon:yes stop_codon:yes gene_type:complete
MNYKDLENLVIDWAEDRDIFANSNPIKQIGKTQEELDETLEALNKLSLLSNPQNLIAKSEAMAEVKDGIGDMIVTIILLSEMVGVKMEDCLQAAYDEIKHRKGKMVDGLFVKEG